MEILLIIAIVIGIIAWLLPKSIKIESIKPDETSSKSGCLAVIVILIVTSLATLL